MSTSYSIDSQILRLTSDIYKSVAKLNKNKYKEKDLDYSSSQNYPSYSINNFTIRYLNGESIFNIQQIGIDSWGNINNYAYNTYSQSDRLLNKPDILIDFMHKNNRYFDYMV